MRATLDEGLRSIQATLDGAPHDCKALFQIRRLPIVDYIALLEKPTNLIIYDPKRSIINLMSLKPFFSNLVL